MHVAICVHDLLCRQGTYVLEFSKCDDPVCCAPLRSQYRDVLGARFLPVVVPFVQTGGHPGLEPAEPGTANAKFFPDIFTVRALYPNCHEVPRELYLPRRKGTDFNELTCPFGCGVAFPTKTALQRHRVRMHKYKRAPKDLPNEQFEFIPLFDDIKTIVRRANKDSHEFVVETTKNTFEWLTLPLDHDKVKAFLDNEPKDQHIFPHGLPPVNLERWVDGGEIVDDDSDDEMTDE